MTYTYRIDGMTCNNCKASVTKNLSSISGIKEVEVDLAKKLATIKADEKINIEVS